MKQLKVVKKVEKKSVVVKVSCNKCKKLIWDKFHEGDDYFAVEQKWGYFSPWDGQIDEFDLCVSCYAKLISTFKIPLHKSRYL